MNHALLASTAGKMAGQSQVHNRITMLVMLVSTASQDPLSQRLLMASQDGFVPEAVTALRETLIPNNVTKLPSMLSKVVNLMPIALNVGLDTTAEAPMMVNLKVDASLVRSVLRELLIPRPKLNQVTTHQRDLPNNSSALLELTPIKLVHPVVCNAPPVKTAINTQ